MEAQNTVYNYTYHMKNDVTHDDYLHLFNKLVLSCLTRKVKVLINQKSVWHWDICSISNFIFLLFLCGGYFVHSTPSYVIKHVYSWFKKFHCHLHWRRALVNLEKLKYSINQLLHLIPDNLHCSFVIFPH